MLTDFKHRIRNTFITGVLLTLPVAFTFFILDFLFTHLDNSVSPLFTQMMILLGVPIQAEFRIPGVGLLMTLLLIFLVGLLAANILGKKLVGFGEALVEKIPIVRSIYNGTKQVVLSIAQTDSNAFRSCVLVEFPRKGVYVIGFATGETLGEVREKTKVRMVNVFIPTTPNPTSGFLIFVPKEEVIELEMPIEDGVKMIISGGIVTPEYRGGKAARALQGAGNPPV